MRAALKSRWIRGAVAVLCVAGAAIGAAKARTLLFSDPIEPVALPRVRGTAVTLDESVRIYHATSTTRATQRAKLSFTLGGRLQQRPVHVGDVVVAGNVLAELEQGGLDNAVSQARAGLHQASAQLTDARRERRTAAALRAAQVASERHLERAGAQVGSLRAGRMAARSQLAEAERLQAEAVLDAPFDGIVTAVFVEPGEFVMPGQAIVELKSQEGIELDLALPESVIGQVSVETGVRVDLPLAGRHDLAGSLRSVSAAAGPDGLFAVVVELIDTAGVAEGMAAEVQIAIARPPAPAVPVAAIVSPPGAGPAVMRIEDGKLAAVSVEVAERVGSRVRVLAALRPGDLVMDGGHNRAAAGDRVEVVR